MPAFLFRGAINTWKGRARKRRGDRWLGEKKGNVHSCAMNNAPCELSMYLLIELLGRRLVTISSFPPRKEKKKLICMKWLTGFSGTHAPDDVLHSADCASIFQE